MPNVHWTFSRHPSLARPVGLTYTCPPISVAKLSACPPRAEAAAEFQKIIHDRAVVLNNETGAVAHVGLARAYAIQGDNAKAKAAYQAFLALWKDADPDIPILEQAKSEYARLQ
jgi:hypothetical protein